MKLKINKMTLIDILEQNIKELNLSNNKLSSGYHYHRTAIFIHLFIRCTYPSYPHVKPDDNNQ